MHKRLLYKRLWHLQGLKCNGRIVIHERARVKHLANFNKKSLQGVLKLSAPDKLVNDLRDRLPLAGVQLGEDPVLLPLAVKIDRALGILHLHQGVRPDNLLHILLAQRLTVAAGTVAAAGNDHALKFLYPAGGNGLSIIGRCDSLDATELGCQVLK